MSDETPDWEVKDGKLIVHRETDLPPEAVWAILAALKKKEPSP